MVALCMSFSQLWMLGASTFLQASDMQTLVSPGYTEGFSCIGVVVVGKLRNFDVLIMG